MIDRLAIVGVGLLGGSLAKAARARGLVREIVGIGRDATRLRAASGDGVFDRVTTDLVDGVRGADLVVLCAPVLANERLLETVWGVADSGALVTDVGSTKASLVRVAHRLAAQRTVAFVGSHPMAGSEQSGYAFARPDLFERAIVIVTPTETTDPRAVKTVTGLWEAVGARVAELDPDTHDRVVAVVSHLPHLVAVALMDAIDRFAPGAAEFAGRGFRDTTRIAAGDAELWRDIFLTNRDALLASVRAFRESLDAFERLVTQEDAERLCEALMRVKRRREAVR